jgi:hypothetical protein
MCLAIHATAFCTVSQTSVFISNAERSAGRESIVGLAFASVNHGVVAAGRKEPSSKPVLNCRQRTAMKYSTGSRPATTSPVPNTQMTLALSRSHAFM